MATNTSHLLFDQTFELLPERAIFWREAQCLLIADLHLGKASHFRKSGIAVPLHAEEVNLKKLKELFEKYQPRTVLFLGDLFHSRHNEVWSVFATFLKQFPNIEFQLVQGNHDILPPTFFAEAAIAVYSELAIGSFLFTHDRVESNLYNIHGHLHPAVRLKGVGRQRAVLPCFYFGNFFGILPSFGSFTGSAVIAPKSGDHVYVVAGEAVLSVG